MNPKDPALTVNIFIKNEEEVFVAHCLELDIVTEADTLEEARKEIIELIIAQIDYAFNNDNIDNLFRPAPREVWQEFYQCLTKEAEKQEQRVDIKSGFSSDGQPQDLVPPWIIVNTCSAMGGGSCLV